MGALNMKKELNKWRFLFSWGDCWYKSHGREFNFALIKLISFPPEGEMTNKENYKGFWIRKNWKGFNFKIEIPK